MNGISGLVKEPLESSLILSAFWGHSEMMLFCELGSRAHLVVWLIQNFSKVAIQGLVRVVVSCEGSCGEDTISGLLVRLSAGFSSPLLLGWGSYFPGACLLVASQVLAWCSSAKGTSQHVTCPSSEWERTTQDDPVSKGTFVTLLHFLP